MKFAIYECRRFCFSASLALAAASGVFLLVSGFEPGGFIAIGDNLPGVGVTVFAAVSMSLIAYVFARYRWRIVVSTVACLAHDLILTFGVIAALRLRLGGAFAPVSLTIIAYSLNGNTSFFDRLLENRDLHPRWTGRELINLSANQSLGRLLARLAVFAVVLIPVFIFSSGAIRAVSVALFSGFAVSCYSALFIAPNLWALLYNKS